MDGLLVPVAAFSFFLFLLPSQRNQYWAIVGWAGMTLNLLFELPSYLAENNFVYPALGVLSVPFLIATAQLLVRRDPAVMTLSRAAAIAFCLYAPFAYIEPLGQWLISVVVVLLMGILNIIGFPAELVAWNMVMHNGFRVEIILACTGIQSIAIMLGVAGAVPTTVRQKSLAVLLIVPVIFGLNIFRNAFVIMGYTGQWFPYFPQIASNGEFGYESFFWAHNVICELLALVILVGIAYGLFVLIPQLGAFADDLITSYRDELKKAAGRGTRSAE
ncbi:MAG: archaeosortase A [Methanomicrobiales archaeon]|nr:archaeosortase A [Methanomicrobiales archaeon]